MLAQPSRLLLVRPWLLLLLLLHLRLLLLLLRLRLLLLLFLVTSLLPLARLPPLVLVPRRVVLGWPPPSIAPGLHLGWRMSWPSFLLTLYQVWLVGGTRVWPLLHLLRLLQCLLCLLHWLHLLLRLLCLLRWLRLLPRLMCLLRLWCLLSWSPQCLRHCLRTCSMTWLRL
jgi:hypothetical protein